MLDVTAIHRSHPTSLVHSALGVSVRNPNTNIRGSFANRMKKNTANYGESISKRDYCSTGRGVIFGIVAHVTHCKHRVL